MVYLKVDKINTEEKIKIDRKITKWVWLSIEKSTYKIFMWTLNNGIDLDSETRTMGIPDFKDPREYFSGVFSNHIKKLFPKHAHMNFISAYEYLGEDGFFENYGELLLKLVRESKPLNFTTRMTIKEYDMDCAFKFYKKGEIKNYRRTFGTIRLILSGGRTLIEVVSTSDHVLAIYEMPNIISLEFLIDYEANKVHRSIGLYIEILDDAFSSHAHRI